MGDEGPRTWHLSSDQAGYLAIDGERLAANSVFIWAESASSQWPQYKEEALVLVPEPYQADDIDTFFFTFNS
jgi:hypothetical protein